MKTKTFKTIYLATACVLISLAILTACSSDSSEGEKPEATTAPITLTLAVPQSSEVAAQSRVGDPGEKPVEISEDWNRLTIIVAYKEKTTGNDIVDPNPQKMIYMDTFNKKQFEQSKTEDVTLSNGSTLSKADANGFRNYTMYVPLGTVNVYGITYSVNEENSSEASNKQLTFDPTTALNGKENSTNASEVVEALTISNNYAGNDLSKFMSVATGYATIVDANGKSTGDRDLKIVLGNDFNMKQYWRMPLTRLATILDIQWDAQNAYDKDESDENKLVYNDVKVNSFQYIGGAQDGTTELQGAGYGRLFPSLQAEDVSPLGGTVVFHNQTEISKRNSRAYHYVYPDGSTNPSIKFHIDATPQGENGENGETRKVDYTLKFYKEEGKFPFKQASWYKINVKIKGANPSNNQAEVYVN